MGYKTVYEPGSSIMERGGSQEDKSKMQDLPGITVTNVLEGETDETGWVNEGCQIMKT